MTSDVRTLHVRIEARDMPPLCPDSVGIQRGREAADIVGPGTPSVTWEFDCRLVKDGTDVLGPEIQGRPGARFIYLDWGSIGPDGVFTMRARSKLMLASAVDAIRMAGTTGGALVCRVVLSDIRGPHLTPPVRPPRIEWQAES